MSKKPKANPADVREWALDLERSIHDHPDAARHNPDLQAKVARVRDEIWKRYDEITENGPGIATDRDLIP